MQRSLRVLLSLSTALLFSSSAVGWSAPAVVPANTPPKSGTAGKSPSTKTNSATPRPSSEQSNSNKNKTSSAQQEGKVDGSFVNGKYTISEDIHKNGFHKGEPVVVIVDKGSHYTYVFQKQNGDKVVEVLRASNAVGKDDTPTPYGPYKVADKLKWPSWIPPKSIDPKQKAIPPYNKTHKNPLGVARIGLNKFGIMLHGTNDPHSLRKDVSHGCIRHSNADIMKIYNMVKVGDTVIIAKNLVGTTLTKKEFGKATK